jgi:hypothetical protein
VLTCLPFLLLRLQGYAPGFPVLLPLQLSQARSAAALQYLLDGNYLDKQSAGLSAQLLAYNADLRILGQVRINFQWRDDGSIDGEQQLCCCISQCVDQAAVLRLLNVLQGALKVDCPRRPTAACVDVWLAVNASSACVLNVPTASVCSVLLASHG